MDLFDSKGAVEAETATSPAVFANRFSGKTAIVTGGASGMGRAQARRLAAEGASVAIVDVNAETGPATAAEIAQLGGRAIFVHADLTDPAAIDAALGRIRAELGPAHLLFNNAGTVLVKRFEETTEDEYDHIMDTNVRSAFMVTKRVIPQLLENNGGSIVLMSSISALRGFPLEAVYGMSKAAVQALMMNITAEYRERGIRCNAICPAFVRTPHGIRELADFRAMGVDISEADMGKTQLRISEPEDVANVALFLASKDAGFLNGLAVPIDNGWMAIA